MSLPWLPINACIEYKLPVICHSVFLGLSPIYLSGLLSVYTPNRNLRSSSDNGILCIPKLRTKTFGHRSFSFAASTIWISLPSELRHTDSILKFKSALKTDTQNITFFWPRFEPLNLIHLCEIAWLWKFDLWKLLFYFFYLYFFCFFCWNTLDCMYLCLWESVHLITW